MHVLFCSALLLKSIYKGLFLHMDGRLTSSSFSPVLLRCQLVFFSHWAQANGFIPKVYKQFSTSPQGLVKPNYIMIGRGIRPLEFRNRSSQIWKWSCTFCLKRYYWEFSLWLLLLPVASLIVSQLKSCTHGHCVRVVGHAAQCCRRLSLNWANISINVQVFFLSSKQP